jgi:two-component system OmpR family response regulator
MLHRGKSAFGRFLFVDSCRRLPPNVARGADTNDQSSMHRVLLIDDDAELTGMLSQYLTSEGFESYVAATGMDGIQAAARGGFDAIILDIMLPDTDGIKLLRRMRQADLVPIIMLSAKGSNVDRVLGLESGADDYVAKPFYPPELVARLRAIIRRRAAGGHPGESLTLAHLVISPDRREAQWRGIPLSLTVSEFNIMAALMRAGENVTTKDSISEMVLGRRRASYDRSVDVHISNLRRKLGAIGDELEIETVRGVGYRIKKSP